jgi:hypothetical protein
MLLLHFVLRDARERWKLDQDNHEMRLQYSSILAKSISNRDNAEALLHLRFLVDASFSLRETLYEISLLCYNMKDFTTARYFCEELYKIDPDCKQISNLHKAICYKNISEAREAKKELLTVGAVGAVAVLACTVLMFMTSGRKSS